VFADSASSSSLIHFDLFVRYTQGCSYSALAWRASRDSVIQSGGINPMQFNRRGFRPQPEALESRDLLAGDLVGVLGDATSMVADLNTERGTILVDSVANLGPDLFLTVHDGQSDLEIWELDADGNITLKKETGANNVTKWREQIPLVEFGGKLYFTVNRSLEAEWSIGQTELWVIEEGSPMRMFSVGDYDGANFLLSVSFTHSGSIAKVTARTETLFLGDVDVQSWRFYDPESSLQPPVTTPIPLQRLTEVVPQFSHPEVNLDRALIDGQVGELIFFSQYTVDGSRVIYEWLVTDGTNEQTRRLDTDTRFVGQWGEQAVLAREGELFTMDPQDLALKPLATLPESTTTLSSSLGGLSTVGDAVFFLTSVEDEVQLRRIDANDQSVSVVTSNFGPYVEVSDQVEVVGQKIYVASRNSVYVYDVGSDTGGKLLDVDWGNIKVAPSSKAVYIMSTGRGGSKSIWKATENGLERIFYSGEFDEFLLFPGEHDPEPIHALDRLWFVGNGALGFATDDGEVSQLDISGVTTLSKVGDDVYFLRRVANGRPRTTIELWKMTATDEQPSKVTEIEAGYWSTERIVGLNGLIIFGDGHGGLYRYDEALGSTEKITSFPITHRESYFSGPLITDLTVAGDQFFFAADSDEYGNELWVSDGTIAGTRLAVDIRPGFASSWPNELEVQGDTLYFTAIDNQHGR